MSIVTITDGLFGCTETLGRRISSILGYRYIGEGELSRGLQPFWRVKGTSIDILEVEPPSWKRLLEKRTFHKNSLRAAICGIAECDNFVYHGRVGQELLPPIRHILRILVIFPNEYRIEQVRQVKGLSRDDARSRLAKMDDITDRRIKGVFGVGWLDSSRYDIVLNVRNLSLDTAIGLIVETARKAEFQTTCESESKFQDFILEGKLRGALLASPHTCNIDVRLQVRDGLVHVLGLLPAIEFDFKDEIIAILESVSGVSRVNADIQLLPTDDFPPVHYVNR
jgi:cytidylate kinase